MTQTPLEAEAAAATVAAGADLDALSSAPAEAAPSATGDQVGRPNQSAAGQADAIEAKAGPLSVTARFRRTPKVLLATGVMVGGILLTTAVLVWVATTPARRHPVVTALALRRR